MYEHELCQVFTGGLTRVTYSYVRNDHYGGPVRGKIDTLLKCPSPRMISSVNSGTHEKVASMIGCDLRLGRAGWVLQAATRSRVKHLDTNCEYRALALSARTARVVVLKGWDWPPLHGCA